MANVLVQESSLQDIADAIRTKNGTQNTYKPAQMADAIEAISGGGITPTGTINITTNGTHDVTNYASASVAVPTGTTPTGTKQVSITQNGTTTEDVTNYASAEITVNVPSGSSTLGTKTITANGTYNASSDSLDGYSSVTVNVSSIPTYQNTTAKFTNSRSSGTANIFTVRYDETLGCIGATNQTSVANGNTSSDFDCMLQNGYIYVHTGFNVSTITYNNADVTFSENVVGSNSNLKVLLPDNYDPDIPFVLT